MLQISQYCISTVSTCKYALILYIRIIGNYQQKISDALYTKQAVRSIKKYVHIDGLNLIIYTYLSFSLLILHQ